MVENKRGDAVPGAWRQIAIWLILTVTACGFPRPDHVVVVGGQVRGLWSGTDGVALRLQGDGHDGLVTIPADGEFRFPDVLVEGTSYAVTVAASPNRHTCVIDSGSSGTATNVDITNISVTCTGPEVRIGLSGQWGWVFDPLQESQTFAGSVVAQDVALKVSGDSLSAITVDGAAASVDETTAAIPLPLGSLTVPIELTASGGLSKSYRFVFRRGSALVDQIVYGKASNADHSDRFGEAVALSGDTLAIGAPGESSGSSGINSSQSDNSRIGAGAVYIFVRTGTTWTQQAYIKASNPGAGDFFGSAVSLSGDTLAVSAIGEDSGAIKIGGDESDDSAVDSGAVYVFTRSVATWTQQAYIKGLTQQAGAQFGASLSLQGDTLAVAVNQVDYHMGVSEAVDIFSRVGAEWTHQTRLTAPPLSPADPTVASVLLPNIALAENTLAISAQELDFQGHQGRGAVYLFVRAATTWSQQAYLTGSEVGTIDQFGESVALSGDTLAIGAPLLVQGDMSGALTSSVYVYARTATNWVKQASLTASNSATTDEFGTSVAISDDTIAVGARREASKATGADGDQTDDSAPGSGAVYLFTRTDTSWAQSTYLKASNTGTADQFGQSIALSRDTLVVGSFDEASGATGINPENAEGDDSAPSAGAIYIFR